MEEWWWRLKIYGSWLADADSENGMVEQIVRLSELVRIARDIDPGGVNRTQIDVSAGARLQSSVRDQRRDREGDEYATRNPAQDEFPKLRVTIAAHHD
jgi:hypothetical protein